MDIPYYGKTLSIDIDERNLIEIGEAKLKGHKISQNRDEWFKTGSKDRGRIADFIKEAKNILFIVNDHTRPTPTSDILTSLRDLIPLDRSRFIIASGDHRNPTEEELKRIFGELNGEVEIVFHEAQIKDDNTYFGKTSFGTEIYLNKVLKEVDSVVAITSVESHFFAGFTGGRKSFIPGISAKDTIEQNHSLAMREGSGPMILEGNPVHEDMDEVLDILGNLRILSIQATISQEEGIYNIHTGDIRDALLECCEECEGIFSLPVEERADVLIASATPPLDINLYQSQKAIEHSRLILNDGGILILLSSCYEGIGPDTFYQMLSSGDSFDEIRETIRGGYKLGYHKVTRLLDLFESGELWLLSELDGEKLKRVYIKPIDDLQKAIDEALEIKGENARVAVLKDASTVVPVLV